MFIRRYRPNSVFYFRIRVSCGRRRRSNIKARPRVLFFTLLLWVRVTSIRYYVTKKNSLPAERSVCERTHPRVYNTRWSSSPSTFERAFVPTTIAGFFSFGFRFFSRSFYHHVVSTDSCTKRTRRNAIQIHIPLVPKPTRAVTGKIYTIQ